MQLPIVYKRNLKQIAINPYIRQTTLKINIIYNQQHDEEDDDPSMFISTHTYCKYINLCPAGEKATYLLCFQKPN